MIPFSVHNSIMDNENNESENFCSSSSDDDEPALDLDLNALQQLASSRLDRHCVHARRLTKGLYNEIYLLQFEAGPDCIARLSCDLTHLQQNSLVKLRL